MDQTELTMFLSFLLEVNWYKSKMILCNHDLFSIYHQMLMLFSCSPNRIFYISLKMSGKNMYTEKYFYVM